MNTAYVVIIRTTKDDCFRVNVYSNEQKAQYEAAWWCMEHWDDYYTEGDYDWMVPDEIIDYFQEQNPEVEIYIEERKFDLKFDAQSYFN